ncbi:MAG: hypothetical protein AB1791_19245 [Chloroflexota bacterium]
MYQVAFDKAQVHLFELIEAAIKGEDVFIQKDNQWMVQLVPVEPPGRHPQFGSARGLIVIADDFDAPLPDFDEYMA